MRPKNDLVRIVKTPEGTVAVDETGKVNGRGVYICKCKQCVERAAKNKSFAKNFGFALTEELVACLEKTIERQN
ncbi:MAG: YlxR family protein [Corallococcus sp.]|nr:YlxR family protein [Corallococcus sp.]MCM1359726.1 YlxR family protein [Corallococcus sp.]MCM1395435.1 YlxR family protein [Corallococcus sp.]